MKPKTYYHVLKNSLNNPAYYLELLKAPLWLNIRFFLISMTLLGVLAAVRLNKQEMPVMKASIEQGIQELKTNYPPELTINWTGSQLETNLEDDLKINYPKYTSFNQIQLPAQLGYLVPEDKSLEQLKYNSFFVITPSQLFISDLNNNWTESPLDELLPAESFMVNQESLPAQLTAFQSWSDQFLVTIKKINYALAPLFLIMTKFWVAVIDGFLVFLLMKINKIKFTYKQVFQLSLHLVVIAELVSQISLWIYPQINLSMFTLTYWIVLIYLLWSNRKSMSTGGKGKSS